MSDDPKKIDPADTQELRELISRLHTVLEHLRIKLDSAGAHQYIVEPEDRGDRAIVEAVALPQIALDRAKEAAGHAAARLIETRAHLAILNASVEKLVRGGR